MAFSTTSELAVLAEKELGHDVSSSSTQRNDILSHMDNGHKMILSGGDILNVDEDGKQSDEDVVFNFARAATPKSLLLRPAITDRTVTITRGSTSLTFDSQPDGANSVLGWHIRINGESELYYISAHTANTTSATIEGGYVGAANASASSATLVKLRYDVGSSDILRLISPIQSFSADGSADRKVSIVDKEELYESCPPDQVVEGFPTLAGMIQENAGTYTIQFDSYPSDYELLEVDYVAIPSTLNTSNTDPTIPARFRNVLSYVAAYYLGIRNNDSRAPQWLKMAQKIFRALVAWDQNNVASTDKDYSRVKIKGFSRGVYSHLTQKGWTES